MALTAALMCMALNVYWEARGEPLEGQQAVALVTWNRAARDHDKVCQVVTEPKQFSWTITKLDRTQNVVTFKKSAKPRDHKAWALALFVARMTLHNKQPDLTHGSTHYHADYVKPIWRHALVKTATIGRHHFYKSA